MYHNVIRSRAWPFTAVCGVRPFWIRIFEINESFILHVSELRVFELIQGDIVCGIGVTNYCMLRVATLCLARKFIEVDVFNDHIAAPRAIRFDLMNWQLAGHVWVKWFASLLCAEEHESRFFYTELFVTFRTIQVDSFNLSIYL